ncbi:MAG: phytanoyl-CoA dioxygenase family protein, partial [Myxococcota bacterium]
LPARLDAHQALIAPGARTLGLVDLCIETDGEPHTLSWQGDRATVVPGRDGAAPGQLSAEQLSDIVNDQSTPVALMSNRLLQMPEGGLPDFLNWWLVLRAALDSRRVHAPGDVAFSCDVRRSFAPDDTDEDMRAFLEEAGYLHIKGLFSEDEMAAVEADYPTAAPHFEKGDPRAWFATTRDGVEHLVRMEGFDRYSETTVALIDEERFQRIARIPGLGHEQKRAPGSRVGALTKPIGVVKGISDVPWHKDCSLGRHSYECCSLTVGISVTGADAQSGQLRVVPGTHRALVWPAPCVQPGLDLEPVDLPTETGDVTVHLSCTQHMSQPPVTRTRKVLYTGFAQRPTDPEAAERNRRRLNAVRSKTHTSVSQPPGYLGD